MRYKDTGVDIDAGNEAVKRMKGWVRQTFSPAVLADLGGFGGLFRFDVKRYRDPVLVSSIDGVGTKLKLAFLAKKHDTVGQDLVNHCVNDILVQGARPLFFMDYIGAGKIEPSVVAEIVKGLSIACKENGCALLGGETAEMPGFYQLGEYDVAGCIVGILERGKLIDGRTIRPNDGVIGLASTGLHTNGYSLARKILFGKCKYQVDGYLPELRTTVGKALLKVHRSYLKPLSPLIDRGLIKGLAHITGGGFYENIPRILPQGCRVEIRRDSWPIPALFGLLQEKGRVPEREMYRVFNMGIGMIAVVREKDKAAVLRQLGLVRQEAWEIGRVVKGKKAVRIR